MECGFLGPLLADKDDAIEAWNNIEIIPMNTAIIALRNDFIDRPLEETDFFYHKVWLTALKGMARTLRELVSMKENDVLKLNGIGEKRLSFLKYSLKEIGLHFGMTEKEIKNWLSK